jgi:hypothetical protein
MTRIVVDAELRGKLHNLSQPLELLDEKGQLLGRYLPVGKLGEPQLSEEELQRREQEPEFTTQEVLARLERL